jgi:predicted SprT family Zn-dependent metalloprotease
VHIQPQSDCLLTTDGRWGVDFIGRVEHMDEDMRLVLEEIELRRSSDALPVSKRHVGFVDANTTFRCQSCSGDCCRRPAVVLQIFSCRCCKSSHWSRL